MNTLAFLLALSPLALVLLLLLWRKQAADTAGALGLALCVALAWGWCGTDPGVLWRALLSGLVGSLPVGIVIAASIWQISVMAEAGALASVAACLKRLTPEHKAVQVLLIAVCFGVLLTGLGATTMAILPPLLTALGYSVSAAIILSTLGYVAFCMYALLGVPVVILAGMAGQSLADTGHVLAQFMPLASVCVAFACLHAVGGRELMRKGAMPALIAGGGMGLAALELARLNLVTLTAIFAGLAGIILLLLYVAATGGVVYQREDSPDAAPPDTAHTGADTAKRLPLMRALSPWLALVAASLVLNTPALPLFDLVFSRWAMPVEIIPKAPEKLRLFWQAYTWVIICTLITLPVMRVNAAMLTRATRRGLQRAWRPLVATALYFMLAYVMNHSGKAADFSLPAPEHNMILLLAQTTAQALGNAYAAAVPFVGLLGGFVSGSASSGVAMLTHLQVVAAQSLEAKPLVLACASAVGAGLASAMSPSKLFSAGASLDQPAAATQVMGYALVVSLGMTAVCAVLAALWAF